MLLHYHYHEILDELDGLVFHSDLLVVKDKYDKDVIAKLIIYSNSLYAVSSKGGSFKGFLINTNFILYLLVCLS